jgi:hypothetical protein
VPDDSSVTAVSFTAPDGIPGLPGLYSIDATGVPGLHAAYYGSASYLPDDQVQSKILEGSQAIAQAAGFPPAPGAEQLEDFKAHVPFELTVSADAIKGGFYSRLNALQAHRNTFWTGAAWQTQDSSIIWNFTEYNVLPKILA